ncbi:male-specific lethal 1 homolog isoform X1 [Danio aesculapii]|uniref:male-specific lethal 1 homolog isoform X1 n=1 Tax=Danio aesculapii TaxID=1142201 RepID=UPI0024BF8DEA|nr:male-specific lethal 1 homolog isoform X1 [Danio aesculapii]XP_056325183.1 male-specific lethal 1 homolog isoform X1 [Danio aesculapii]
MNMRPECFSKAGLYSKNCDFSPSQTRHPVSVQREIRDPLCDTPDDTREHLISQKNLERASLPSKPGRELIVASEAGSVGTETLSSQAKQMGGEGTPVKSKTPFGQTNAIDNKPEFVSMNSHINSRDPVGEKNAKETMGASHEHSEGKRTNMKKISGNPHAQASCLKQLLLLQLDLIEQQQQQLQAKDKEIDELKSDRDTLLARIERMERRLQLLSKEPRDKRLFQPLERWVPDTDDFWESDLGDSVQTQASKSSGKVQKRKLSATETKTQRSRGKSTRTTPQKSDTSGPSPCQRELRSKETPEKANTGKSSRKTDQHAEGESSKEAEELPYMTTTEMYLCCWEPPDSSLQEDCPKKEEDVASRFLIQMQNAIYKCWLTISNVKNIFAVPSWRENIMEPLKEEDAADLPESLDDSVFLKRHAKLELDEKRRKRWDIQRIREQRMLQRLQQRMEKKKPNVVQESEPEVSSFHPDLENVEAIMVTPFLPVVAFGRPLPNLTPQNFELPWLDEKSKGRVENQKKQTPHRTCRK